MIKKSGCVNSLDIKDGCEPVAEKSDGGDGVGHEWPCLCDRVCSGGLIACCEEVVLNKRRLSNEMVQMYDVDVTL
jgi:hypothetical protein